MNSVKMTLLSMTSRSSVDGEPAMCSGGHGINSCWGLNFFFVPHSRHVDQFTFHILYDKIHYFFTITNRAVIKFLSSRCM